VRLRTPCPTFHGPSRSGSSGSAITAARSRGSAPCTCSRRRPSDRAGSTLARWRKGSFADACVDSASGLNEALERPRDTPPVDLVLLDPRLPGCSGLDALLRLRAEIPRVAGPGGLRDEDGDRVLAAMEPAPPATR
jgi:hypothetical protein